MVWGTGSKDTLQRGLPYDRYKWSFTWVAPTKMAENKWVSQGLFNPYTVVN